MSLSDYTIDIYKLSNKVHQYQYRINHHFFENFAHSPVTEADLKAEIMLDKQVTLITLGFHITGTIAMECDRSLEMFDHPVDIRQRLLFQYGPQEQELTEEMIMITRGTQSIEVAQYLYEFITLAVPMKKLHPRYEKDGNPFVDGEVVYTSDTRPAEKNHTPEEDSVDPRWSILKKFKQ